jgi:ribosomal-protein-serine acetyltransferase
MMEPLSIVSNRVVLRQLILADAQNLYDAVHESRQELGEWLDWCREEYVLSDAVEWIEQNLNPAAGKESRNFGVFCQAPDKQLIGCVGLSNINWSTSTANLGYWIRSSHIGNGFAREAAAALAEYTQNHLRIARIEIVVHPLNLRSARVARALNAIDEGLVPRRMLYRGNLVDAHIFSI